MRILKFIHNITEVPAPLADTVHASRELLKRFRALFAQSYESYLLEVIAVFEVARKTNENSL